MTPEIMAIIALLCANMWLTWKLSGELAQRVVTVAKELDHNIGAAIQTITETFGSGEQQNLVQSLAVEFFRNMKNNNNNRPRGDDGKFIEARVIENNQ